MNRWRFVVRFGLLLLLCLAYLPAGADPLTMVKVVPAAGSYEVGQQVGVEVLVENVADLYGVDIQLAFDPAYLLVVDAEPTWSGVQVTPRDDLLSPDFCIKREADNEAGTIWYAATQVNPSEPVTGSGALFEFTIQILAVGESEIVIQQQTLSTRSAEVIPAGEQGAVISTSFPFELFIPCVTRKTILR